MNHIDVCVEPLDGSDLGVCIQPRSLEVPLEDWLVLQKHVVVRTLLDFGFMLFRGFKIDSAKDFDRVSAAISDASLEYIYRSTPRTAMTGRVYTASEYPAEEEIPLHNENAYQRTWPLKLAFCCLTSARSGGETMLADMRRVTGEVPGPLLEKFCDLGVRYVRNYRPYMDLSWQVVFQTEDPEAATRYCNEAGITATWRDHETFHTEQTCQGVAKHPATGETVFFNQAHLFHISNVGSEEAEILLETYGYDGVPRNSLFGDGTPITEDELETIRSAFSRNTMNLSWQAGDVLLLDNMRVAHGRRRYRGDRILLTSLLDPYSPSLQSF